MIRNQFRHRIDAERFTSVDAGGGSTVKSYHVCHRNIPCLIVNNSGKETLTIGKKTHWISHSIFMSTLKNPTLQEVDRIKHTRKDGTFTHFEIIWVKRERELDGIVRIDCVERDTGNPPSRTVSPPPPSSPPIPPSPPIIPSEVYAHWHLNESAGVQAADSSGNDRHGTCVNMEDADWKAGKLNNCLKFDGVDEHVNLGNIANFERTDAFSLECWFKTNKKDHDILNRMMATQPFTGWCIFMNAGGEIEVYLINTFAGNNYIRIAVRENFADSVWHHIIMTYDGLSLASGMHIYIDGIDKALTVFLNNLTTSIQNTVDCRIAARDRATYHFEGFIDETVIYDKELSPAQIAKRWNSGAGREDFPSW